MKVTEPLDGTSNQYNAGGRCTNGYQLPSGYRSNLKGLYGFPNQNSDFDTLEKHGVRKVVPGVFNHWFWSSSVEPFSTTRAYYFGGNGGIDSENRDTDDGEVICVSDL